jgi:hypothetical protein
MMCLGLFFIKKGNVMSNKFTKKGLLRMDFIRSFEGEALMKLGKKTKRKYYKTRTSISQQNMWRVSRVINDRYSRGKKT